MSLSSVGTFFLMTCWYAFNCGSTLGLTNGLGKVAARCAVTTTLAGVTAAITAGIVDARSLTISPTACMNGCLTGLVAITAGCSTVEPWAAVIVGILSGFLYPFGSWLLSEKLMIDDPVDASVVHGMGGILGVLVPGFFSTKEAIAIVYAINDKDFAGVFMGGSGIQLGYQLLFIVWIIGWSGTFTALSYLAMKYTFGIRVSAEEEMEGLDKQFQGATGYDYLSLVDEYLRKTQRDHENSRRLAKLLNDDKVALELAESVASMDFEAVSYLDDIHSPTRIQSAFIKIVSVLKMLRPYLPQHLLAKQIDNEEDQGAEEASLRARSMSSSGQNTPKANDGGNPEEPGRSPTAIMPLVPGGVPVVPKPKVSPLSSLEMPRKRSLVLSAASHLVEKNVTVVAI